MVALFGNPMGLMGYEFVEFASPTANVLEPVLGQLRFSKVALHRSRDVLYRARLRSASLAACRSI